MSDFIQVVNLIESLINFTFPVFGFSISILQLIIFTFVIFLFGLAIEQLFFD